MASDGAAGALAHLHLNPQGFLFDHHSGLSFSTNGTGAFILDRLIQGRTRADILRALVESWEVAPDQAATDLDEFVQALRRHRVLPRDKQEAAA
ncbi:MAG: PqqD family protein [bacterium]|jgi:hypothetical protein|nr:PqqD family protein [bacterium]